MTVTSHRKQLVLDWLFGTLSTDGRRELEVTGVCHSDLSSVYT
ncbi:hypothetical protein [Paenibacillus lautus]|nr:hypothetical protein [Paenibacillus lautus]